MAERLDAVVAREYTDRDGNQKTQWTKIGSAWPAKNNGWSITLDALPVPVMGERGLETRILLMVPKPRDNRANGQDHGQSSYDRDDPRTGYGQREDDQDLPF